MSGRQPQGDLKVGGQPRVQLLPARVKQREKARGSQRFMVLLVVLAVVVAAAGIGWAYLRQSDAQAALDAANLSTADILAQQAEYAEATRLAALVALTEQAQEQVTATEIQWVPLMTAIAPYIPSDVILAGIKLRAPGPWEAPSAPEGPLRVDRVAVVTLQFDSPIFGSVAPFVERIPELYGFADVSIDSTELGKSRLGYYTTTVTLTLDADAVSQRYTAESTGSDPSATPTPTPTGTPAVTPSPTATEGGAQ